jgi:hypothetical protein
MSFVNSVYRKIGQGDTPMTISIQTLHDTLVALFVSVGVAVALSLAFITVGAFVERGKARSRHALRAAGPAQHQAPADDTRELVLR